MPNLREYRRLGAEPIPCSDCEGSIRTGNVYYRILETDQRVCAPCADRLRRPELPTELLSRPAVLNTYKGTANIKRKWGIEIECYTERRAVTSEGFSNCGDGSISAPDGDGIEYKTDIFEGDKGLGLLKNHCAKIEGTHAVNQSCGLHVHVDVRDLKPYQIVNITSFIRVFEPLVFHLMTKSRRTNRYCGRFTYRFPTLKQYRTMNSMSYVRRITRYKGFNLQSFYEHGTIEFRYHSGTVNYNKIKYWLLMCLRIVEYQKEIFWDSERRFNPKTKKHWELFFSTLQLPDDEKKYWQERFEELNRPEPRPQVQNELRLERVG